MLINRDNPFTIKEAIGKIPGFKRLRQEGNDFWIGEPGEKIYFSLSRQKFRLIFFIVLICMSLILARAFWLQIIHGGQYNLIAEGNRIRLQTIKAERGLIYDRFNNPLVFNVPNFSLYFTPADLSDSGAERLNLAAQISPLIDKSQEEIMEIFNAVPEDSYQPVLITDNLSHSQAISLAVMEDELPGIQLIIEPRREYLEEGGLSHVLGYIGKINQQELEKYQEQGYQLNDYIGKDGIELYYEQILKGIDGKQEIEVDATGKAKKILNKIEPQIGDSLILTIDLDLQKKINEVLTQAIKTTHTQAAVAIAQDPQSGEILALVSLPGFDNNFFSAGIQADAYENYLTDPNHPLFNRAISGTYPPGSSFKPIVALAALEEGIINESKTFLSTGGLQIDKWFFPDWKYGGHGRINVITAIAESVNTFFYYIGGGFNDFVGLGVDKITQYAQKFNLSKKLGVDLPGEAAGFLPNAEWKKEYKGESWYIGDTYHLSIGQGDILVSPLQVSSYMATIANSGTLYQPHLLKDINYHSTASKQAKPIQSDFVIARNFISPENIDIVRRGLRATITRGSAQSLQSLPVAVAGKTGTAQVGGDKLSHAWFSGFAPYESPSIVLTILIENGGEGSAVAVPVFKEVMEWYFSEN